jgi:AraC family transcriptional regulator
LDLASVPGAGLTSIGGGNGAACCWIAGGGAAFGGGAVLRVVGNNDNLELAALYLYRDWLPASGEEARGFSIYCQRLSFFPEVAEHETLAELFLPLK